MNQTQLLALMAELAQEEQAFAPDDAMAYLAEYLERTRLAMDQADSEALLYVGACIWKLQRCGPDQA
ncbi:hypothetical protein [Polaromonas jejuensis]|uniref:Uncharacterized protein n=1 Tax=Polaromonas jejuensis TaxID=457502 RepID=A0ABW0QG97_9BURK|nr:hypothetical protein [Polaromonas jejuensis]